MANTVCTDMLGGYKNPAMCTPKKTEPCGEGRESVPKS